MKNYIGAKVVKAIPGTPEVAQLMRTGMPHKIAEAMAKEPKSPGSEGYIVAYPDGYISWSPKRTFEETYRELGCEEFINSNM